MNDLPTQMPSGGGAAAVIAMIIWLAVYAYFAYSLMVISQKTGKGTPWWGWVPILNVLLMLQIADKPGWWILLCLVPLVNIVILIIVWMKIAEARGKPNWWGILMIVPIANLVVPGYLAFTD